MVKVAELTWEDVAKEYPKFREVVEKYPNLKGGALRCFLAEPKSAGDEKRMAGATEYRSAIFYWHIMESGTINFVNINKVNEEAAGPFLVLGTWIFIKRHCNDHTDPGKLLVLHSIQNRGGNFWAKFLGYPIFDRVTQYVVRRCGSWDGRNKTLSMSYELFDEMISEEWK